VAEPSLHTAQITYFNWILLVLYLHTSSTQVSWSKPQLRQIFHCFSFPFASYDCPVYVKRWPWSVDWLFVCFMKITPTKWWSIIYDMHLKLGPFSNDFTWMFMLLKHTVWAVSSHRAVSVWSRLSARGRKRENFTNLFDQSEVLTHPLLKCAKVLSARWCMTK